MANISYTEIILLLIILAFLFIVPLFLWWRNKNSLVINWPVVGMAPALLANSSRIHDFATDVLQQNGGTFVFKGPWFWGLDFLLTSDPTNLAHILSKNFSNYHKGPEFREIFQVLGDGIFPADGESWKMQRRIIHSFLKESKFEVGAERFLREKMSKALFSILDHFSSQGAELDLHDVFHRFTFDISCKLMLDFDPNSLCIEFPDDPLETAFHELEVAIFNRHIVPGLIWKLNRWLQIGIEKKATKSWETLDCFLYKCIARKREELTKNGASSAMAETKDLDFLTYILSEEETEDGEEQSVFRKSDKFLRDMVLGLLSAQSDTTSSGLAWTLWMVATHPIVEAKILREMKSTQLQSSGDDDDGVFTNFQDLSKLVYLHATINEALRLYPSIPFELKVSIGADILPSGHRIDKNTRMLYSIYSIGRMKKIWGEDCLEFKPERWISEEGNIKRVSPYKFLAFNAGPRSCLGKDLAMVQMKAVVGALIWKYCFRVVENHHVSPSYSMQLSMKSGLKVRVSKRWNMS